MNTQLPILNVAGLQNAAKPATQADSFTAEVPFNQVLNKEVSNRNNDTQPKTSEAVKDTAPEPAKTDTAPTAADQAKPTDKKTASSDDKKDDDQAKKDDDDDASSAAASAQMLALVTNLGHIAVQPAGKKPTDESMDALADRKAGKKAIGHVGADAKKDQPEVLGAADDGKEKGKKLDFAGMQKTDAKETFDGKTAAPARASTEKALPESPAGTKSALANLQDAAAAARTAKPAVEANVKPLEAAAPNAGAVIPTLQQTMALSQQAAMSGQSVQRLTPAVGSQGWDQALGQKMVWMTSGGMQSASLTLNPPDLGPLQVVIHVNNSQADATFITAQPEVKHALEAAMPKLREMMDQAGIQLGQATVNTGMPSQHQGAHQQQQARSGSTSHFGPTANDDADINVATIVPRQATSGGQGIVDTFA